MLLFPKKYVDKITDIKFDFLKENNIHAIILDMDNTIVDYNGNILERSDTVV